MSPRGGRRDRRAAHAPARAAQQGPQAPEPPPLGRGARRLRHAEGPLDPGDQPLGEGLAREPVAREELSQQQRLGQGRGHVGVDEVGLEGPHLGRRHRPLQIGIDARVQLLPGCAHQPLPASLRRSVGPSRLRSALRARNSRVRTVLTFIPVASATSTSLYPSR